MSDFLISALAGLDPYVPGEQPQGREYIKLNTNESPFPPSPRVLDALSREEVSRLNLYSDPTALPLRRAIADTYGLSPDNVFCGNGSDEVLGFSFLAFADGAHPVTFPAVSYGFYRVFANLFRVPARTVPPVSYTHLDVYKRQPHCSRNRTASRRTEYTKQGQGKGGFRKPDGAG